MVDNFLELGFNKVGQFQLHDGVLYFRPINFEYDTSIIVYSVLTDTETLYIGETINMMSGVLKDLTEGNPNRATRDRIHSLIKEYSKNSIVYFVVNEASQNSKQDLIERFSPVGNINGLK